MNHLRNRFRREYLSQLIAKRSPKELRELKVGAIVLIGDDNRKRLDCLDWPLVRVVKLILGRDNVVRVAVLKTKEGLLKRPIQRVYPLEINSCEEATGISRSLVSENIDKQNVEIAEDKTNEISGEMEKKCNENT